ncbi:hypothetical protein PMIN01_10865 [Paraphaeosphaeria minitans]|uniref:Uncharacterized protein n=1 Tax=Paraphaeosphaeria minitans TaxID=565426 RepID=A0A9P6G874_9PLEO|nr:hypothetical protein PMIN01_10865 [Paraphaeosphaeria minitans]
MVNDEARRSGAEDVAQPLRGLQQGTFLYNFGANLPNVCKKLGFRRVYGLEVIFFLIMVSREFMTLSSDIEKYFARPVLDTGYDWFINNNHFSFAPERHTFPNYTFEHRNPVILLRWFDMIT